jgi:integrase
MARVKLRYVNSFKDRFGKWRHYFRRGRMKAIPLPPVVGSKIFNAEYAECLELYGPKATAGDRSKRLPGTLGWVIKQYKSPDNPLWSSLSDGTKDVYNRTFDWLDEHYGRAEFASLEERHVRKIRGELKEQTTEIVNGRALKRGGTTVADRAVDKIGMLWRFAKEHIDGMDRLGPNPAKEVASVHTTHKPHPAWPPELMAAIEAHPNPRVVRAYFLLRYTGQRRSDVVTMDKARFDGTAIQVVQEKTGTFCWIPAHKHLRDHLAATGIDGPFLLQSTWGTPYEATSLTNMIIDACKDAGFPGFSPHGLRHSAGSALAEAGCTVHEIMSILGHLTEREAMEYVRQANRKVMAKSGMGKWEAKSE